MQHSPNRSSPKKSKHQTVAKNRQSSAQHVSNQPQSLSSSALLRGGDGATVFQLLPYETLCHISSYLDPPSLASLAAVNRYLHEFLSDDVVWKLALFANILDIRPEREHESPKAFLLRRLESTWKAEYITRYNSLQHWSESRTSYTAHNPLLIPVPNIHLLSDGESLLVAPEHFSWILRTIPARGKVLKGHFQPKLPNQAHPTPDWSPPSAGAIVSDKATAKIAWGSQTGHVMVKTAQKAMDPKANRNTSAIASTLEDDPHEGFINHITWATSRSGTSLLEYLVTAGEDGCVKLWNAETCTPIWTSPRAADGAPFVRAEFDTGTKTIVAITESGHVIAWSPIPLERHPADAAVTTQPVQMLVARIPSDDPQRRVYVATTTLLLNRADSTLTGIIHVKGDQYAWCFTMNFEQGFIDITRIDGPLGAITAVHLELPTKPSETPILMVGDALSQLSIYNFGRLFQDRLPSTDTDATWSSTLSPTLTMTAHSLGAVTAIAFNRLVLLTGNDAGMINVWDAVTLKSVRTIDASALAKDGVGVLKLVSSMELVIASVGRSVLHWQTGGWIKRTVRVEKKIKTSRPKTRMEEYELAIKESQAELEMTSKQPRQAAYTEQDQLAALRAMGLDESGAVEYALMLSHDEALRAGLAVDDEATELAKIASLEDESTTGPSSIPGSPETRSRSDSISNSSATVSISGSVAAASPSARSWSGSAKGIREEFMPSSPWKSTSMTKFSPPKATGKVQISPPYRPEAVEIGRPPELSLGPALGSSSEKGSVKSFSDKGDGEDFPSLSAPPSTKVSRGPSPLPATQQKSKGPKLPALKTNSPWGKNIPSPIRPAMSQVIQPTQARSSWSTIVKTSTPASTSTSATGSVKKDAGDSWSGSGVISRQTATSTGAENRDLFDEDRELQFVLELSRAEALSREANEAP